MPETQQWCSPPGEDLINESLCDLWGLAVPQGDKLHTLGDVIHNDHKDGVPMTIFGKGSHKY